MKHAKKMMLIEAPSESTTPNQEHHTILIESNDPEKYVRANNIPDLNKELKIILNRTNLSDREKWVKYNQILQRYLFFLNEEKQKNSFNSIFRKNNPFDSAPTTTSVKNLHNPIFPNVRQFPNMTELTVNKKTFENSRNSNNIYDEDIHINENENEKTPTEASNLKSDEDEINISGLGVFYRPTKRNTPYISSIDIKKKKKNQNIKPIYVYMPRPALNRWEIDQKTRINKAKQQQLKEHTKTQTPVKNDDKIISGRLKRSHDQDDLLHMHEEFNLTKKRPRILQRDEVEIILQRDEVEKILKRMNKKQIGTGVNVLPHITSGQSNKEKIIKWDEVI